MPRRYPIAPGNINLYDRPYVTNPNGDVSTVRSMGFQDEENGPEILVPTVRTGKLLSAQEAIDDYHRTGKHLGIFATPDAATSYSEQLHNDMAAKRFKVPFATSRQSVDPIALQEMLKRYLLSPTVNLAQNLINKKAKR